MIYTYTHTLNTTKVLLVYSFINSIRIPNVFQIFLNMSRISKTTVQTLHNTLGWTKLGSVYLLFIYYIQYIAFNFKGPKVAQNIAAVSLQCCLANS